MDSADLEDDHKTEIVETVETETKTTETKTTDKAAEETTKEDEKTKTDEDAELEVAEPEIQTEITTKDEIVDDAVDNRDENEVTPTITTVEESGYLIKTTIDRGSTSGYLYLYWKEKGKNDYKSISSSSTQTTLYPTKPNTTYILELRSGYGDSAQVYDEKEFTTTDYKFRTSTEVVNTTADSAEIKVTFTDYTGIYPNGTYTYLYAGTDYTNIWGTVQTKYKSGSIQSASETKECSVTISVSDLQAGTNYTLPIWVAEYNLSEDMRKPIETVEFTTTESTLAEKLQFEATPDESDKTKINYTASLSDSDTLTEFNYNYSLSYRIKGAPLSEARSNRYTYTLYQSNQYKGTGSITGLYAGTEYELITVFDGVMKTIQVSTDTDGITTEITATPLSFGAKLNIELTGISEAETSDSYSARAYVKDSSGYWNSLSAKTKTSSSSNYMNLTTENNYQGEWLVYNDAYMGAGASYDIRVDIQKSNNVIGSKYFTITTPQISLNVGTEEIEGRIAQITCELAEADEYFEWGSYAYARGYVYYRVKGSDSAWEKSNNNIYIDKDSKNSTTLYDLALNTEYEVKIACGDDENVIYGTTEFKTTEGVAEGAFSDMEVRFSSFDIEVMGYYIPSDYADKTEMYLVETDGTGNVLAESKLYYSQDDRYISVNTALLMETAKVQIKAVETLEEKDEDGNPVKKEYLSREYNRTNVPKDVVFEVSNISMGVTAFRVDLTYTGNMNLGSDSQRIYAILHYGTSDETTEDKTMTNNVVYAKDGSTTQTMTFQGLTENTTYHGKLVVYAERELNGKTEHISEQEIVLDNFTTKANATYNLETTFPDARLRELIVSKTGLGNSATEVTTAQLEKITSLSAKRSNFDTEAIKDLTGIELLTELTSLNIENNEVSDVSEIEWSSLAALNTLNLIGNDLTAIPNLSNNANLTQAYLNENMIPEQEFVDVSTKIPAGVRISNTSSSDASDVQLAQQSQRVGGLQVIAEETYYQRAGKSPLLIKLSGYKTGLPYEFKYFVDEKEITLPQKTWDNIWYNADTGIAVGEHTLTVEMYKNSEKEGDERTLSFNMAEGGAFVENMPCRFNAQQSSYSLRVCSDKELSAVYMQKGSDIVAMDLDIDGYLSNSEYRYKVLSNNSISLNGLDMYSSWVSLDRLKQMNPQVGTYDLRLVYKDDTVETLSDVIEIIGKAYIQSGGIGYNYDSTGAFFYLSINGYGFDASKLDYTFTYNGTQQSAEYVNAKETSNGYIVKFKKADAWTPKEDDSVQVKVAAKSGYEVVFDNDTFTARISQGIYYCAYNEVTNKIEVGVTSNLKRENVTFQLERYNTWNDMYDETGNAAETIALDTEIVTETLSYLLPMKEGVAYQLPSGSYYKLSMVCGDYSDNETFSIYGANTDYWSSQKYVVEGIGDTNFYYYSLIPYVKDNQNEFTAELTGEGLTLSLQAKKIWTYSYADGLTTIGMTFDLSTVKQGNYTVTVSHNNKKLSAYTFTVLPGDKFVMLNDDMYASWIDDSSFRLTVYTINTAETDQYTVSLTDVLGNKVAGLQTEVTNRYSSEVSLKVTGLKKEDAYRYYYIYVEHNTLREAYKPDRTTKFFADEKGKYEQIYDSDFTYTTSNNRMVGVGIYSGIAFPVTMKVYKPYDTELVTSVEINESDLENKTSNPAWYYFKQSLIDSLPEKDKDALYDIVLKDTNGKTSIYSEEALGIRESSTTGNWTVLPTQLTLNLDSDAAKTGIITVTGNTGTPTFQSENTNVATVAADRTDKNKAVVTAVAEGTATISVTVDKTTKTVAVTVTKEPIKPTGITVTAPESAAVGGKVEISATVLPAGAWTQQSSITWTSSDTSVISIPAGSNGLVVEADALKTGEATITAALDDTEFTASCTITVVKEVSDEEQDELAKEIGTLYFLEGADTSLADIVLPAGWSWEKPAEKPTADNSHPIQDFVAVYDKDDVTFERYLDVYVSKLDSVRITGKSTVNSGKSALYTCVYTYVGADFGSGYDVDRQWTLGQNLAAQTTTGERIAVTVSGKDTLSVQMTVTNTITKKSVSLDASLAITAGEAADTEPELENKKITIFKNSTQLVPIGLVAKDGNAITDVKVKDNAKFTTKSDDDGEWLIGLTASGKGSYEKKTTETLTLTVTTESGQPCEKTLGVTVDVTDITTKNVKLKQTLKPNAAYSDTETVRAEFNVSSKYIIEDITAASSTAEKFTVKSYNAATGTLVLEAKASALDLATKSYPAKADVKVRDYGTWTLNFSVAVQNKKPSLKLGEAVILSGVNADASVALYNGKKELSCADYTVTSTVLKKENNAFKVVAGTAKGSYTATIRKNTWAKDVNLELKGKVSELDPQKAKLAADVSKATINISEGYSAPVTVTVGIKGSSVSTELTAKPAKDKDAQAVTVDVLGGGKIRITPTASAAKGSYKIEVKGSIGGTAVKGMTIAVTLTDKAPGVKLAAKGKINLANREGTSIVYTPTLKNLPETLSIKSVRMDKTAAHSELFTVKLNDEGKLVMTAVTGKTMDTKTKYKPVLVFTLSNGKTLKTGDKFTVSVTNKLPKVTVTTLSGALCTSNAGHRASYKLNAGNGYTITNVTTSDKNYKVTFNGKTDTVSVSLADGASVTAGKKYTVMCTVYIKGADNTTKPLTVKLKTVVY